MNYSRRLYASRFSTSQIRSKKILWTYLAQYVLTRYIKPTDTVLDLGAGYCECINALTTRRKYALDPNPDLVRYAHKDVITLVGTLKNRPRGFPRQVDVFIISNLLEHLPDRFAVLDLLAQCRSLLSSHGKIIIIQPNISLVRERYWDHIDHHIALNSCSLQEAVSVSGFRIIQFVERFLPLTVQSNLPVWPPLIALYLALPSWARPFAGQSLLVADKGSKGSQY